MSEQSVIRRLRAAHARICCSPPMVTFALVVAACDRSVQPASPKTQPQPPHLVFIVQPGQTQGSQAINPAVQVTIEDSSDATIQSPSYEVSLALGTNPSGGTLSGTTDIHTVDGTAVFSDLSIDRPGQGYTLVAQTPSSGVVQASSAAFDVRLTVTTLSAGDFDTCATTATGAVYCWGSDVAGQLGNEDSTLANTPFPTLVSVNRHPFSLTTVSVGGAFACGLTVSGAAYCWGLNHYADLGIDSSTGPQQCSPGFACSTRPLAVVGGLTFNAIASVGATCGVTPSDAIYCWGLNATGELGTGVPHGVNSPVPVLVSSGPSNFVAVSVQGGMSCGLTSDDAAYCWGQAPLGDSTLTSSSTPVRVAGGWMFSSLHSGEGHTCGLTSAGVAYCWASNGNGQIGDGTTTDRLAPVPVVGGLTFSALSGGWYHTCGVTPTDVAYCWGRNESGQLGNGTVAESHAPVIVSQGLTFTSIAAGRSHTCGLTAGGIAYCWGSNSYGELGNGTMNPSSIPVPIVQ